MGHYELITVSWPSLPRNSRIDKFRMKWWDDCEVLIPFKYAHYVFKSICMRQRDGTNSMPKSSFSWLQILTGEMRLYNIMLHWLWNSLLSEIIVELAIRISHLCDEIRILEILLPKLLLEVCELFILNWRPLGVHDLITCHLSYVALIIPSSVSRPGLCIVLQKTRSRLLDILSQERLWSDNIIVAYVYFLGKGV